MARLRTRPRIGPRCMNVTIYTNDLKQRLVSEQPLARVAGVEREDKLGVRGWLCGAHRHQHV